MKAKQLLFVACVVHDDANTVTSLEIDSAKLNVSEPTSKATAVDAVLESSLLAPFSQLHHLNLAHNKVMQQLNILL